MWGPLSQPGSPTTPMKVLGLGLPRAGTSSSTKALELLFHQPGNTESSFWAQAGHARVAERHARRWVEVVSISLARVQDSASYEPQRLKYLLSRQFERDAAVADMPGVFSVKALFSALFTFQA